VGFRRDCDSVAEARTPVTWPSDTACMTVVDRSQSAVLQFPCEIPREDTELASEEMPGSRRQQFVAVCRADPHQWLPTWISQIDDDDWNG
jgi:hypothetical protein